MTCRTSDFRRFGRVSFAGPVRLTRGTESWQTSLVDISLKGMLLNAPAGWTPPAPGTELESEVLLHGVVRVKMTVRVVRHQDGRVACEWSGIDIESLGHLRRILELNRGPGAPVATELRLLAGTGKE